MKIFLDDIREPKDCLSYMYQRIGKDNPIYLEQWTVCKNCNEFIEALQICHKENIKVTHVSFDHDLADEHYHISIHDENHTEYNKQYSDFTEKTGLGAAKFLKEMYEREGKELPIIYIHTMNPCGLVNITNVFK